MSNFLDRAAQVLARGEAVPFEDDFRLIFKAHHAMGRVFAKATLDLDNIEVLYSAFEMAELLQTNLSEELEVVEDRLSVAIRRVIVRTLEVALALRYEEHRLLSPTHYSHLAQVLAKERIQRHQSASIVTFNYDTAFDLALTQAGVAVDYVVGEALPRSRHHARVELLKLHGSLNWFDDGAGHIRAFAPHDFFNPSAMVGTRYRLDFMGKANELLKKDLERPAPIPVIVPPTWSKTAHYAPLTNVWSRAAARLAQAEQIIVVGYSLPKTDEFFRYLYALGTMAPSRLRRLAFISPDEDAYGRFKEMLGGLARSRLAPFGGKDATFEESLNTIEAFLLAND